MDDPERMLGLHRSSPLISWTPMLEGSASQNEMLWGGKHLESKTSGLVEALHVDDLFTDGDSSDASSYNRQPSVPLPGWNTVATKVGGVDSDSDAPDQTWFGGSKPGRTLRRTTKASLHNKDSGYFEEPCSPGASMEAPLPAKSPSVEQNTSRPLRQCISAPELQRGDPILPAPDAEESIDDFLADLGWTKNRIQHRGGGGNTGGESQQGGSGAGPHGRSQSFSNMGAPSGSSSSSALFQRRANQREGKMPSPNPVAVPPLDIGSDEHGQRHSRSATFPTDIPFDQMTEEQKSRLAQLHQAHVSHQAARLGVYSDFVAPSQQFAGQEASERAAKAVQAALLYGMEGGSPRRLSVGSTGLATPITPHHPLAPGPSANSYPQQTFPPVHYGMPDVLTSPRARDFGQAAFGYHQQHSPVMQDLQGYTSTYPPPRSGSISHSESHYQGRARGVSSGSYSGSLGVGANLIQPIEVQARRQVQGHFELQPVSLSSLQEQERLHFLQLSQVDPSSEAARPTSSHSSNSNRKDYGLGITSRKGQPSQMRAPPSPPRSPVKMRSSPQLRTPNSETTSGPDQVAGQSPRKIASNRRIVSNFSPGSAGGGSSSSKGTRAKGEIKASKSSSPTPITGQSTPTSTQFNFTSLSFVNYGMEDAEELCSAVAPSGSYKIPLKGYGSSESCGSGSGGHDSDDDSDDEDSGENEQEVPSSKRVKKNKSSASLKTKRSGSNLASGSGAEASSSRKKKSAAKP
ncbi:hypothetical protein IE53DRAFT_370848 [Violaceomyces palustris]|uniref:Uncharacterized protein n=1 Tax=Violaceomyces palustris TaxID=1673888 RepID=A0ACD0NQP2_9BASI|nr:hypothetical protein IE53DRAFT_370848 [Violaceomyces palustris]